MRRRSRLSAKRTSGGGLGEPGGSPSGAPTVIIRKSAQEVDGMARAGQLVAETIALLGEQAQPGITTAELDRIAEDFIREHGGVPTSKGYRGFPGGDLHLAEHDGRPRHPRQPPGRGGRPPLGRRRHHARRARRPTAPTPSRSARSIREAQRLLEVGQQALAAGIDQARSGNRVGDISHAVQQVVEAAGFSVVRSLVGHGVGRSYHEEPQIPNFGEPGRGPLLQSGHDPRDRADDHGRRPRRVPPRRRVVDLDRGRLPGCPLRAHGRRRRGRASEGAHAAKSRERAGLVP